MNSTKRQARIAGAWYLLMALAAPFGLMIVPAALVVAGDAAATADNLRASPWLLRAGIASELVHQVIAIFLVLALYRLFKPVDAALARLVVVLGALVSVPIMFANTLNELAALAFVGGEPFLSGFDKAQLDGLAYLSLHLHEQGVVLASIFWGLWLFPFGRLVMLSGFIPAWLGVLLMAAGAGYLVDASTALVLPRYEALVSTFTAPLQFGELPIIFWLLIWGARTAPGKAAPVSGD
jgi:hypothetical protein